MKKRFDLKNIFYLIYSLVFALMCLLAFSYFYLNHRTFINHTNDGLIQHYKALVYYSEYLRTILRNIFIEHRFVIPHWDFSIGEGADILQTLHMYAIGDPLSVFSVFFPKDKVYIYYNLSILIRLYLSGIVFAKLCFYTKQENQMAILAGALVYVFCYWSLLNVNEHIYFLNPMIYLPMIVLGVEKVIREDRPVLLTISVFISAISNFYFFYMLVILTAIYVAVRLLFEYGFELKTIFKKVRVIFLFSLLGTLMASVIFLPVLRTFASDSRASVDGSVNLFYSRFYYERLFTAFVSNDLQYDLCMGFASPTILSIGLLLNDKRKTSKMLLCFGLIALLIICLPFAGKVMNGFAYPINRWSFAIALIVAYTFVFEWDRFAENKKYLLIWMALVFAGSMVSAYSRQIKVLVPIVLCVLFYLVSVYIKRNRRWSIDWRQIIMIVIVAVNILYIADCDYSLRGSGRMEDAATGKEAISEVMTSDAALLSPFLEKSRGSSLERYSGNYLKVNAAMLENAYSTDFYWSLTNPNVIRYREKLGLLDFTSYLYRGYDDRSTLYTLANVRYFVADNNLLPYGFEEPINIEGMEIYENTTFLPFGYTYDKAVSYEEWDKLDQIEKQEALLDYVVIENGKEDIKKEDFRRKIEFIENDDVHVRDNSIFSDKEKSVLKIRIEDPCAGEYTLSVKGLEFEDSNGYIEGNRTWVRLRTSANDIRKDIYYFTKEYQFYSGRHDFTACYGYHTEGIQEIEITLPYPGVYTFDDLYVSCVSHEAYQEKVDLLKSEVMQNVAIKENEVSGTIDLNSDKYLLMSIPYSDGWKAYVDGKKQEILRANECYMALKLEKGSHEISLQYETPFLREGTVVSIIASGIFAGYIYLKNRKARS